MRAPWLARRLRRFADAKSGAISVMSAIAFVAVIGFVGLAVDVGSVYLESRQLQGAVDLAALEAAGDPSSGRTGAVETLNLNGFAPNTLSVERGHYAADRAITPDRRFVVNAAEANAVRVRASVRSPLYFARLFVPSGHMTITRDATAAQARMASFQIGSRLLSLNGGIANDMLTQLTGSSVNLSVMEYNALLNADVDLLTYMDALRTRLDLEAASFDQTLNARAETSDAIAAIADVLEPSNRRAASAMRELAQSAHGDVQNLDELIDLGPYGAQDVALTAESARIEVKAMDLATAILQVAGGDRQVRLNAGAGVPGLADTQIWLAIGERPNNSPWIAVTDSDEVIIRTAQMRLYVETNVNAAAPLAQVRIPVLVEAASAQARLSDIQCGSTQSRSVTLSVAPSIGSITLGEIDTRSLDNFRTTLRPSPARLARVGSLVSVDGEARVELGGQEWRDVRFSASDIANHVTKTVATRDAARATVSSLLGQTRLTVRAGGLGLGVPGVTGLVNSALTRSAAPLDGLLNGIEDLLGLHLGEADVRVNGVRCGGAVLVA